MLSIVLDTSRQCTGPTGQESASTQVVHCGRLVLWRSAWWGTILGGKERTARRLRYSLSIKKKKSLCILAYLSEDLLINLTILIKRVMEWEALTIVFWLFPQICVGWDISLQLVICPSLPPGLSSPSCSSGESMTLSSLHMSQRHSADERHEGNLRWMAFKPSIYVWGAS